MLEGQRNCYMNNIYKKGSDFVQRKIDAIDEELRKLKLNERQQVTRHQQRYLETSIIRKAQIIATTLSSCNNDQIVNALTDNGREHPSITCCIIDEAAQCNETELLLPLTLDVSKMILVGDPLQLTATTFSQVSRDMKYGKSLFSRIYKVWENNEGVTSTSPINFLDTQYRMHPSIASWPSRHIYKGRLKNNNLFQKNSELNSYMLINHNFQQSRERETNYWEAQLVVSLAFSILKKPSSEENMRIGIITPYANQRIMMQSEIHKRSDNEGDYGSRLEVNSIDGFQGQERDVIIVSMVRSEGIGFMNEIERINVMLTRAEKCLLVCANFNAFLSNHIWKDVAFDFFLFSCMVIFL
ncbi:helicase sen1 isoform X2 [Nilaparvata lugens]|uniref:helicase sen1 isoform X2 n=1 Tax=Nilaparvata lugens TaxID=108931 RepID=UPI00193DC31F|nr:helicase sen1 isoform X2 [Nilaparvata lugens]